MTSPSTLFGMPVLAALGIDTKNVTGFQITCNVGEFPTIAVTSILPQDLGEPASQVLRKFRIEPVEEVSLPVVDESVDLSSLIRTTHRLADSLESDRT